MNLNNTSKQLYIVISQTGTVLSRILKFITGAEYNHASISLSSDMQLMYSFGRLNPYNPFWGGFVTESPNFGTFKRFSDTKVIVLEIDIDRAKHEAIKQMVNSMVNQRKKYRYNYLGLWLAGLKIIHKSENRYYCSEFVKHVLEKHSIDGSENLPSIVQPIHFLELPDSRQVYCGKLSDYSVYFCSSGLEPLTVSKE